MMKSDDRPILRLGHSPDPDDAFMWWPLLGESDGTMCIDTGRFRFETITDDIESLNARSVGGKLEITAMSCAQYPHVQHLYAITSCGASVGEGYGPKIVARRPLALADLKTEGVMIAVPGERTTAFTTLCMALGTRKFLHQVVPFEEIIQRVASGEFDAGVVIHEGQLTFEESGLQLVVDLGSWWREVSGLPLPLGINSVRRDLELRFGQGTLAEITGILRDSIQYAMQHRERSLAYALKFARGMSPSLADSFVQMYVNNWTLDFGEVGRLSVLQFLKRAHEAGLLPRIGDVAFVKPSQEWRNEEMF